FSSRRRHTRCYRDWSSDVCSSDLDRNLLHANTVLLKLQLSFFLCERAKHKHIVVGRLYDAGVERQSQTGVQDHAQERTPASAPAAVRASCRERGEVGVGAGAGKKG